MCKTCNDCLKKKYCGPAAIGKPVCESFSPELEITITVWEYELLKKCNK